MTFITALIILVGLAGVIIPFLPGLALVWAGVALWSFTRQDAIGWVTLAVASSLVVTGSVVKYLLPGRRLRAGGVGWPSLASGAACGIVGFVVIPVIGLVVGFVFGIYLAELIRYSLPRERPTTEPAAAALREYPATGAGASGSAWASTRSALAAVGWSILIELGTGLLVAATWTVAVVLA